MEAVSNSLKNSRKVYIPADIFLKIRVMNFLKSIDSPICLPSAGIKTYYLPFKPVYNQAILPSFILTIPLLRNIFIREQIEIVHAHGAFSVIGNQALFHAIFINPNLKTVFTDHSLFGFADTSAIITNKVLQIALWNVDSAICVSHTGKENTVLRGKVGCSLEASLLQFLPSLPTGISLSKVYA